MDDMGRRNLAIYQQQLQMVYRIAYTYLQNRAEAEKAAQEVFVRLFRNEENLISEQAIRAYLVTSTTNICLKKLNDPSYSFKADENPHEIDETMAAVMALPGKYKTVAYLFYCEELTAAETAELMGDEIELTRSIIGKTRRALALRIGDNMDGLGKSYDKIRIDANSAVQIWKNILTIQQAIEAMLAKQRGEEPTAVVYTSVENEAEDDETEEEMPNPFEAFEKPEEEGVFAPADDDEDDEDEDGEAEQPVAEEDEAEDVRIFIPRAEAAKAQLSEEKPDAVSEEDTVKAEDVYESDAEVEESIAAEEEFDWASLNVQEDTELSVESEAAEMTDDAENTADDNGEAGISRRRGSVRRKKRRSSAIPSILIGAAIAIAAAAVLLMLIRGRESENSGSVNLNPELSVPVVTARPAVYEGPKQSVDKISAVQAALGEWEEYIKSEEQKYVAENMPSFDGFLELDSYFDGTDIVENGDGTYSFIHWKYDQDWGNTVISPITGLEEPTTIQKFDYENSVTVEEEEYKNYITYKASRETEGSYGEYNYSYGVANAAEGSKLEEIAAAHNLSIRKDEGERFGIEDTSSEEMQKQLANRAAHGPVYSVTPEIDYVCFYESGAFEAQAKLTLSDGRRMYTLLCGTPYTEMIDALSANGITQLDGAQMQKRSYTAANGTEITIMQNEKQAILYAYFDEFYVVADLGINAWREEPAFDDTEEQRAAKVETNLTLTDEAVNFIADSINFQNLGY